MVPPLASPAKDQAKLRLVDGRTDGWMDDRHMDGWMTDIWMDG